MNTVLISTAMETLSDQQSEDFLSYQFLSAADAESENPVIDLEYPLVLQEELPFSTGY